MYEAVHATPEGDATVARLALTAREFGYDGIVVRNRHDEPAAFDAAAVAEATGVDVVSGIELRAEDPETASGHLGNYRPDHELVAVHGGTPELNRFAVEQPAVDVLARPLGGDGDVNHVIAEAAAANGVRLEFDLRPVLRQNGGSRVRAVQGLRKLHDLVEDADAPFVVTGGPRSHLDLRAHRELVAVGEVVGLAAETVLEGLREWRRLAERNRDRRSESFVEPGVRIVDGELEAAGEEPDAGDGERDVRDEEPDAGDGERDAGDRA